MALVMLIVTTFLFTTALCTVQLSSKDADIISLNERLTKMDALLQEVQSHSRTQEEQSRALLTNLLSQLTQNTQELSTSKTEISKLKEINKKTLLDYTTTMAELDELNESHNQTLGELEMVKNKVDSLQQDLQNCSGDLSKSDSYQNGLSQLNSSETEILVSLAKIVGQMNATGYIQLAGSKRPWQQNDIGFEASLTQTLNVTPSDRIVFDKVTHNEGNGYNNHNGYFTVPVSGTYLCWTNIVYESHSTAIAFRIQTMGTTLGSAYGNAKETFGAASVTTVTHLKKGDRVGIAPSRKINVSGTYSSAGAVLI